MSLNIDTTIHTYTPIKRICDYVSKALPTVFDDSLSYYEELSKILRLINEILDDIEDMQEDIQTLKDALDDVADYIEGLDLQITQINTAVSALQTRVTALEDAFDDVETMAENAAASATAAQTAATNAQTAAQAAQAAVLDIKNAFGIDPQTGGSGLSGDNDTTGLDGIAGNILIDSTRQDFNTDIYNVHDNVKDISSLPFSYGYCKAMFNNAWVNLNAVPLCSYTATSFENYTWEYAQASGQPYYEITKTSSATKKSIVIDTDLINGSYIFLTSDQDTATTAGEVTAAQYYNVTNYSDTVKIVSGTRAYNNDFSVTEKDANFSNFYVNGRNIVVMKINKQSANKKSWVVITCNNEINLHVYISEQTHLISDVKTNVFYPKATKYVGYLVEDASTALGFSTLSYVNDISVIIPRNLIAYEIFNALAADTQAINLTINDVSSIVDMINGEVI